ncbi:MAG: pyrroline-5-carboxylate reductase [Planctomycetia bacterium]
MTIRIGFIGGGQMARALAVGFLRAGKTTVDGITAGDVSPEARRQFEDAVGGKTHADNAAVCAAADLLVLAVKPQYMTAALAGIKPFVEDRHLVASIAAGVTLAKIADVLGANRRLVRVMPNTPSLVGAAASGVAAGGAATAADLEFVVDLFRAVGVAYAVPEPLLDAVTGLSGSGPAYVYQIIEALADGGVKVGLPRDVAVGLAAQTVLGAARMVLETGLHPGVLKDQVASPGGTTIAGLAVLESRAVRGALIEAVSAATARAKELGSPAGGKAS